MEGLTCNKLLPQLHGKIDPRQFSHRGRSTTDTLLFMLQVIYEAVDHNMRLNPIKCKEMLINFMLYPTLLLDH